MQQKRRRHRRRGRDCSSWPSPQRRAAADAAHGKVVFQTCAACHTDKPDAIGPSLRGVYGRKSAALADFRYSNAMTRANLTWDDANLQAYIKDPQAKVKGNRMPFGGLSERCGRRRRHRLSEGLQVASGGSKGMFGPAGRAISAIENPLWIM